MIFKRSLRWVPSWRHVHWGSMRVGMNKTWKSVCQLESEWLQEFALHAVLLANLKSCSTNTESVWSTRLEKVIAYSPHERYISNGNSYSSFQSWMNVVNYKTYTQQQLLTISERLKAAFDEICTDLTANTAKLQLSYCKVCQHKDD